MELHFHAGFTFSLVCIPWLEAELGLEGLVALLPSKCAQGLHTLVMAVFALELVWLPPSVCTDEHAGDGCLPSSQRQGWDLSRFHSFQVCTLLLAIAASTLVGSSVRARAAGAGAQWGPGGTLGWSWQARQRPGSFQSVASVL